MKRPLRLRPEARAEFDAAADWYERQSEGLGPKFVARIGEVFDRIRLNPEQHAIVHGHARRALAKQFPYAVIYAEEAGEVIVLAVVHTARDPSVWQSRL